ncbi:MAG TPA: hypothetical protein VIF60_12755 [Burkholderiaceae bacterium]|jgi:hypothetical protein
MARTTDDITPLELRKQLLITQGAMYRSGIAASKQKVVQSLHAESLARTALKQFGLAALSAWRTRSGIAATSMPALLPIVFGGLSKALREHRWKPLLRGILIAGTVASVAAAFFRYKSRSAGALSTADMDDAEDGGY